MLPRPDFLVPQNIAGEASPPDMVPAIGEIALLLPHATGNQEGGGGTREPRPSEVARKQLIDEDARSKARALKAAQDARKDQQEDK